MQFIVNQSRFTFTSVHRTFKTARFDSCSILIARIVSGCALLHSRIAPLSETQRSRTNWLSIASSIRKLPRTISRSGCPLPIEIAGLPVRWDNRHRSLCRRSKPSSCKTVENATLHSLTRGARNWRQQPVVF